MLANQRKANLGPVAKNEECVQSVLYTGYLLTLVKRDEQQLARLKQLGMSAADEAKLTAMRDYIFKHAASISR